MQVLLSAIDSLPHTSVLQFDEDFRFIHVRGGALSDSGVEPGDFEGKFAAECLPAARWETYRPMYEAALRGETTVVTVKAPLTEQRFQVRVGPTRDVRGRINGGISVATDVTASEFRRASAEERFRLLAETSTDVFLMADASRTLTWVSPTSENILGFKPSELIGRQAVRIFHADHHDLAGWDAVFTGQPPAQPAGGFQVKVVTKDGEFRWVSATVTIMTGEDGAVTGVVAGLRDIDELVRAREDAEAARNRLRATMEALPDPHVLLAPIAAVDRPEFVIVDANPAAAAVTGRTATDLIGRRISDIIHLPDLVERLDMVAQSGEVLVVDGFGTPLPDGGEVRYYDIRAARAGHDVACTWRDVTHRIRADAALARARADYKLLAENSGDVIMRLTLDGQIQWVSPASRTTLGLGPAQLLGHRVIDFIHPDDLPRHREQIKELTASGEPGRIVSRFRTGDGSYRWLEGVSERVVQPDGTAAHIVRLRDIDEQMRASQALVSRERQLRLVMESAPIGMAVVGLDRRFLQVNSALCRMLGRDAEWMLSHTATDVFGGDDDWDRRLHDELVHGEGDSVHGEVRVARPDGSTIWMEHSIGLLRDSSGQPVSFVSQFLDITEAIRVREAMKVLAVTDPLTELINRREAERSLRGLMMRSPRSGEHLAVLFCDIDDLKPVNDTYGHAVGDRIIVEAARRIAAQVRGDDQVARIGGDEFLVSLPNVHEIADAERIADKIHTAFERPLVAEGVEIELTVSIGVALAAPGDTPDSVIDHADRAMYRAKGMGRNQTAVHR